jgi:hypothetical protein
VGEQTRYEKDLAGRIERAAEVAVTRPQPIGLTPGELDIEHHPVTGATAPVAVRAYIRFHEAVIRPECEAIAWTDRAVKVRIRMQTGAVHEVWVWASAVERLKQ